MHGQIVRSGLADGRGHDLDDPEGQRDLRDFVEEGISKDSSLHARVPSI